MALGKRVKYSFQEHTQNDKEVGGEMAEAGSFKWPRTSSGVGWQRRGENGLRSDPAPEWKELDPPARFLKEEP